MLVKSQSRSRIIAATLATLSAAICPQYSVAAQTTYQMASLPNNDPATAVRGINGVRADVSALRYYAVRGEQDRVQAEIRRLKQLYPGWKQPDNIYNDENTEEKGLWSLFSKGKIDEVESAISDLQKKEPGYVPPQELVSKIEDRQERGTIASAWNAKDWERVIDGANANPGLLAGEDVELIWFVAEAYARKERPKDSYEAFAAALSVSKSAQERKATLEKAAMLLSAKDTFLLLNSVPEVQQDDNLRAEVENSVMRGALVRSAETGEPFSADIQAKAEQFARRISSNGNANDAMLLAWAYFGQRNWDGAASWFSTAMELSPADPKAVEGAIMASIRLKNLSVAETLTNKWVDATPEIGGLFINVNAPKFLEAKPTAMNDQLVQKFAARTSTLKNGEGAEALGWYAYNVGELQAAKAWFSAASNWEETETSIYGLALTAIRMKDKNAFDQARNTFGAKYPRVAALKFTSPKAVKAPGKIKRRSTARDRAGAVRGEIAKLYSRKRYAQCLQLARKLRQYGPPNAGDHEMRGWCLLGAKRPAEAEHAFGAAVRFNSRNRVASAYGQALSALRSGNTNLALDIANSNPLTRKQRKVVNVELLTQRARAAFSNRDYASSVYALNERAKLTPESRDLTFMRGWAHFHTEQFAGAQQIFETLDRQLSTRDSRKGLAAAKRLITRKVSNAQYE